MSELENMYFSVEATAAFLEVKPRTLTQWRTDKKGPSYCKHGAVIKYKKEEIISWLEAGEVETPTQPKSEIEVILND